MAFGSTSTLSLSVHAYICALAWRSRTGLIRFPFTCAQGLVSSCNVAGGDTTMGRVNQVLTNNTAAGEFLTFSIYPHSPRTLLRPAQLLFHRVEPLLEKEPIAPAVALTQRLSAAHTMLQELQVAQERVVAER
jgi:hypothetical protein